MWLVLPSAALGELHLCAQLTLTEPSAMAAQLAGLPFTLVAQLHTRLNGSETVWGDRLPPTPPVFDYSVLLEGESVASGQLRLDSPDGLSGGILSVGGNQSSLAHGELRVAGLRSAATGFERRTLRVELRPLCALRSPWRVRAGARACATITTICLGTMRYTCTRGCALRHAVPRASQTEMAGLTFSSCRP